jgi:ribosomal protein S18 acetylase RimI-like enzyme
MNLNEVKCELFSNDHLKYMDNVIDELELDLSRLIEFVKYKQNLAFIAKYNDEILGFIYGYSLMSLDSDPQLFIYSVDILNKYQNLGIGSKLFQFVVDYSKANGFSECYVMTDKSNKRACRIYEKAGGKNDYEDEIIYVIKNNLKI